MGDTQWNRAGLISSRFKPRPAPQKRYDRQILPKRLNPFDRHGRNEHRQCSFYRGASCDMRTFKVMGWPRRQQVTALLWLAISTLAGSLVFAQEGDFSGLIRGKTQDRGSYQPPTLPARQVKSTETNRLREPASTFQAVSPVAVVAESYEGDNEGENEKLTDDSMNQEFVDDQDGAWEQPVRQVTYQQRMEEPQRQAPPRLVRRAGHVHQPMTVYQPPHVHHDHGQYVSSYVDEPSCGVGAIGCDGGCDSFCDGCDSCCGSRHCGPLGLLPFGLCRGPDQWFGAVEVMLMFRKGDNLPVLATGNGGRVLFGGERMYDDMTAGGRFKIGTWLDPYRCDSLVFRGWGAGKDSFSFRVDSGQEQRIARPFLNTNAAVPFNDNLLIADPNAPATTGELRINGGSSVYGGDLAIHRQWLAGLGGVVEVLYGYQHLRLTEDLRIESETFPGPVARREHFEADNEFHGGEFGFATRYREGCWSFDGMIKIAAGSVRRTATIAGSPNAPLTDPLFVRQANRGTFRNSTFGWVPELDATIGYRYTQNLDFTIGYHVIAMTDALQVSGTLDPQLAVNTGAPNAFPTRPVFSPNYDTFYIQSIHFGLQYVY